MTSAPLPWPSSVALSRLGETLCRPFESLWIGWLPALWVDAPAKADVAPPQPSWFEQIPDILVAKARRSKLTSAELPIPGTRQCACYLEPDWGNLRLMLDSSEVIPRKKPADSRWPDPHLREAIVVANGPGGAARTPEKVIWCCPIHLPVAVSLGTAASFVPLHPVTWLPHGPVATLERSMLPPEAFTLPTAAEWLDAWKALSGLPSGKAALASPYEATANGPELRVRLVGGSQGEWAGTWFLAGSQAIRAAARIA